MESRFFELAYDMLLTTSMDGRYQHVNAAWTRVLGWSADDLIGRTYTDFMHPEDLDRSADFLARQGDGSGNNQSELRLRMRSRDGSYRVIDWRCAFDLDAGLVHAAGRDVTDETRMRDEIVAREAVLRNLVAHQSETREKEHTRVSGDLHDSAVQHCVAALMFLDGVAREADDSQLPAVMRATEQVNECLSAIRRVMGGLDADDDTRSMLDDRLRTIAAAVARQFQAAIDVQLNVPKDISSDLASVACRVAREGLVNACKHAAPGPVNLTAEEDDGLLRIRVTDAGAGTSPSRLGAGTGRGLLILDARVGSHGGDLQLEVGESRSSLVANLPLHGPASTSGRMTG